MGWHKVALIGAALVTGGLIAAGTVAAQNEQFIPGLVYRTGAYAPNGIPFANGVADYYNLINERDGGINGVKILYEECDTAYATDCRPASPSRSPRRRRSTRSR
jgi:branched-chain amino acid transport system substrate-binding protein